MSPLKHSTNIAARMGRWSARHRKTAIFGWLAFVVASVVIGGAIGMKTIDQNDINVGEARTADHIIRDAGFKLRRADGVRARPVADDDGGRARPSARSSTRRSRSSRPFPQVTKLRSPLAAGQRGPDLGGRPRGADPVQPEGHLRRGRRLHRHDHRRPPPRCRRRIRRSPSCRPGSASTGKALDEMFGSQLARAGLISIPITLVILMLVFGSARRRAVIPLAARAHRRVRDDRASWPSRARSSRWTRPISEVILLIGLAVGVDYSLFYIRRERDERRGGTERVRGARGRRRDVGPRRAHLRRHRDDRDGRDVLLRRQDLHVVRDRDDDGRRGRDDRLAHRPARRCSRGSATASTRCASRSSAGSQRRRRRGPRLGRDPRRRPAPAARLRDRRHGRAARRPRVPGAQPAHDASPGFDALPKSLEGGPGLQQGAGRVPGRRRRRRSSRSRATRPTPAAPGRGRRPEAAGARVRQGARADLRRDVARTARSSASTSRSSATARTTTSNDALDDAAQRDHPGDGRHGRRASRYAVTGDDGRRRRTGTRR